MVPNYPELQNNPLEDTPVSPWDIWRTRLRRLREQAQSAWARARLAARKALPFASGIFAAFLGLFLYNWLFPGPTPLNNNDVKNTVVEMMASATPPPAFSEKVYEIIHPSLVLIETAVTDENGEEDSGLGSGVIIDFSGSILTSLHVVADAEEILVTFADGTQSQAVIVNAQPENDIAVIQAVDQPPLLPPAVMGNPNALRVGDEAFVVGNPFGIYGSMSAGVISGLERSFQLPNSDTRLTGMIQIDAAVNPGNSGGPLLNRDGYVVGIVTGLVNPTEDNFFVGIGFAVPIDVAAAAAGAPQQ